MLRITAPMNRRIAGPYRQDCVCGANLWEGCLPSPYGWIVCPECGRDGSRTPGLRFRVQYGLYLLQKRARLFGLIGMWRQCNLPPLWLLPREIEARKRKQKELNHGVLD